MPTHLFTHGLWSLANSTQKKTPRPLAATSAAANTGGCHKPARFRITPFCLPLVLGRLDLRRLASHHFCYCHMLAVPLPLLQYIRSLPLSSLSSNVHNTQTSPPTTPTPDTSNNGSPWTLRQRAGARPPAAPPTSSHLRCGGAPRRGGRGVDKQQQKSEEWSSTRCFGHY